MRGSAMANEFCVTMAETQPGCQMCVEMQERLSAGDQGATRSAVCLAGLTDSAIPVKAGDRVLGFLQTGQVALRKLTRADFERIVSFLRKGQVETDWAVLEKEYFGTRLISRQQYEAVLRLLEVFAQHLGLVAERIATQQSHAEPAMVEHARQVIAERHTEELSLSEVARAVNTSTFHFCKTFKKATGMTFTEYLALVRVAKAKTLLANPQARISEVAYEAGFASLTHFNRMFRRIAGQSPTEFRSQLAPLRQEESPRGARSKRRYSAGRAK
jgi:AraC-like DNA-binding protein